MRNVADDTSDRLGDGGALRDVRCWRTIVTTPFRWFEGPWLRSRPLLLDRPLGVAAGRVRRRFTLRGDSFALRTRSARVYPLLPGGRRKEPSERVGDVMAGRRAVGAG